MGGGVLPHYAGRNAKVTETGAKVVRVILFSRRTVKVERQLPVWIDDSAFGWRRHAERGL
jgi:hypothetical protein